MINIESVLDSALPIALIVFAVVIISRGLKIVPQSDMFVIERLGKYNRVIHGGLNFIIPFIDSVRAELTTREQMVDIPSQSVITRDNVNITIDGIVFCKVDDGKEATYNIVNFKRAISNLAMTTLRSEIGSMELDSTLSNRETLNSKLQTSLGEATSNWGVTITRVEISDISVPIEIEKAMNLQMEAERAKRATLTKAEADKEATIRNAEAFKQSEYLKAEAIERMADAKKYEKEEVAKGEQSAMESINKAMKENKEASTFLLAKDSIAAFKAIAQSDSTDKMILPYEVVNSVGSVSLMGDAFFKGASNANTNS